MVQGLASLPQEMRLGLWEAPSCHKRLGDQIFEVNRNQQHSCETNIPTHTPTPTKNVDNCWTNILGLKFKGTNFWNVKHPTFCGCGWGVTRIRFWPGPFRMGDPGSFSNESFSGDDGIIKNCWWHSSEATISTWLIPLFESFLQDESSSSLHTSTHCFLDKGIIDQTAWSQPADERLWRVTLDPTILADVEKKISGWKEVSFPEAWHQLLEDSCYETQLAHKCSFFGYVFANGFGKRELWVIMGCTAADSDKFQTTESKDMWQVTVTNLKKYNLLDQPTCLVCWALLWCAMLCL